MNSKRFRLILICVLALCVVVFVGTCYMGISLLSKKSSEMVDLKLKSKAAEAQLDNLEVSKKDIGKYTFFKSVASSVIPNDKDQAQAVLEINQIAQASGIAIQSITFPSSSLGGKAGSVGTPTGQSALSQAVPVVGVPGLYSLKLTITPLTGGNAAPEQQVTYTKMLDFLSRIENNRRTAQVASVVIQPSNGQLNFSMDLNIFIKP
jgi:hypothetical protein